MLTIELKVNGLAVADVTVRQQGPTTPAEADDLGGERLYLARRWDHTDGEFVSSPQAPRPVSVEFTHRRADGALECARKALAALTDNNQGELDG